MFPDQFEPYCYFGCDFSSAYRGTLFRFPLRNQSLARKSEISKRVYTVGDVSANIDQLVGQLSNHLLFLRSVRKISIYHLEAGQREPVLMHEAIAEIGEEENINDQNLLRFFDKNEAGAHATNRDAFYSKLMSTPDEKLPMLSYRITIRIQSLTKSLAASGARLSPPGSFSSSSSLSIQPDAGASSSATLSTSARVPLVEVDYLILAGLRGGQAKRLACDSSNRHLKLVPMGAVAACLSKRITSFGSTNADRVQTFPSIDGQVHLFKYLSLNCFLLQNVVYCILLFRLFAFFRYQSRHSYQFIRMRTGS